MGPYLERNQAREVLALVADDDHVGHEVQLFLDVRLNRNLCSRVAESESESESERETDMPRGTTDDTDITRRVVHHSRERCSRRRK